MQYRIAQLADKIYIAQVQINSSENWFIIEKTGLVCYADTIENRKFCNISSKRLELKRNPN
jgi:hypothetical protein